MTTTLAEEPEVIQEEETQPVEEVVEEVVAEEVADEPVQEETQEDEEIEVTIGEESLASQEDTEQDSSVIRNLRKNQREQAKLIKEQKKRLEELEGPKVPELGKKPSLEDFDYDTEKFEEALTAYHERRREIAVHEEEANRLEQEQSKRWEEKLNAYEEAKSKLKVPDFAEAEEVARDTLDESQQSIIVNCAKDPALLAYAIGKDPARAERLSKIKDYAQFAYELGKLEKDLKVSKKSKPSPERKISSTGTSTGSVEDKLEQLREEAAVTGDMSKVVAYRKKHNL